MADRIEVPMLKRRNDHDELETQCSVCGEHEIDEPHTPQQCYDKAVADTRHRCDQELKNERREAAYAAIASREKRRSGLGVRDLDSRFRALALEALFPKDDMLAQAELRKLHIDAAEWVATGRSGDCLGSRELNDVAAALHDVEVALLRKLAHL